MPLLDRAWNSGVALNAAPADLAQKLGANCGDCHGVPFKDKFGGFNVYNPAAPGVLAQSLGITDLTTTNNDGKTALLFRKPCDASMVHGGPKVDAALCSEIETYLTAGGNGSDLVQTTPAAPQYAFAAAGTHDIIYFERTGVSQPSFQGVRSVTRGTMKRMQFSVDGAGVPTVLSDVDMLPGRDLGTDVQGPAAFSQDGEWVYFSLHKPGDNWQLYKMKVNGPESTLTQITSGNNPKFHPFLLDYDVNGNPLTDDQAFVGGVTDIPGNLDEYNTNRTLNLFLWNPDGSNPTQISFNPSTILRPYTDPNYGQLVFTNWSHLEHRGENQMPLGVRVGYNDLHAGDGFFIALGMHRHPLGNNSMHDPAPILDGTNRVVFGSRMRDDTGGSIVAATLGLLGEKNNPQDDIHVVLQGDNTEQGVLESDTAITPIGVSYTTPASLPGTAGSLFVMGAAPFLSVQQVTSSMGTITFQYTYGPFALHIFTMNGSYGIQNGPTSLSNPPAGTYHYDARPVVKRSAPALPAARAVTIGDPNVTITSLNVGRRQRDGQPIPNPASERLMLSVHEAIPFNQGRIVTGRETDRGMPIKKLGEAAVLPDGSVTVKVQSRNGLQFQLRRIEQLNGQDVSTELVTHPIWNDAGRTTYNGQPLGKTITCFGCHFTHGGTPVTSSLAAKQQPSAALGFQDQTDPNYTDLIQPIWNAKCVQCHNSPDKGGSMGRNFFPDLNGRDTPAKVPMSYQTLMGRYVIPQKSRQSELVHYLMGQKNGQAFPSSPDHSTMLTAAELNTITEWIDLGALAFSNPDHRPHTLSLNTAEWTTNVYPYVQANCYACHSAGGAGEFAMNLQSNDSDDDPITFAMDVFSQRSNFMVPEASLSLRKPLGVQGGLSHMGGQLFTDTKDPNYLMIYAWIASANPALAAGAPPTDLKNVDIYPNPFRDKTYILYGLSGSVASKVDIKIYSQSGKVIRELAGTTSNGAIIGWNKVEWDGKDSNGKRVGNDVYFYTVEAEFTDGTKKKFRGKCIKVN